MYANTHHTPRAALATMRERVARATGWRGTTENLGGGQMAALYWQTGGRSVVVLTDEGVAEYNGDAWEDVDGESPEPIRIVDGPSAWDIVSAAARWIDPAVCDRCGAPWRTPHYNVHTWDNLQRTSGTWALCPRAPRG